MITAFKLGGFFAAHAIWSVSEGHTLTPILAYTTVEGERNYIRFVTDELSQGVALGKARLESNEMDAVDAALLADGRIRVGSEKVDAILIEMRAYSSPRSEAMLAVPYTPKGTGRFRVHKPKLVAWQNCDAFDVDAAFRSFFEGVDEHEEGSKIWDECLDESK